MLAGDVNWKMGEDGCPFPPLFYHRKDIVDLAELCSLLFISQKLNHGGHGLTFLLAKREKVTDLFC
jgi:hypothetical protein